MSLSRESDPCGEIHDALEAKPNGLHARLAIAPARQEAAEHGHQAHHLVEPRRSLGHLLPVQDVDVTSRTIIKPSMEQLGVGF